VSGFSRTFLSINTDPVKTMSALAGLSIALASARVVGFAPRQAAARLPIYGYTVVRSYPHDPAAFTQGLQFVDGVLYEGTGLNGRSSIRRVRLETGDVLQQHNVDAQYFGEGITIVGSELFELTWQSGVAFVYDRNSFAPKKSFKYTGEGWGLTHDGTNLIMSDGTEFLRFLDPATFAERRRVRVTAAGQPLKNLNELEYVKGEVFANVWMTDYIARIDPATGRVNSYIDLRGLMPANDSSHDVLNGIAYDAARDRLFVTGKLWPRLFEIKLALKQ
jgi:glutaminyl-peptide cyclotransferase